MSKRKKDDTYAKAIESGMWWNEERGEHDMAAFFDSFLAEMAEGTTEERYATMRRYGIWFGPQR